MTVQCQNSAVLVGALSCSVSPCIGNHMRTCRIMSAAGRWSKQVKALGMVCRCNAVHPGYGFLSESADFVDMCEEAGIAFLGPRADTMRLFSRKHDARAFAQNAKVPILAGTLQPWSGMSVTCWVDHQTTHCTEPDPISACASY